MRHHNFVEVKGKVICPSCFNKVTYGLLSATILPEKNWDGKYILETITAIDFHKVKLFGKECELSGNILEGDILK